MRPAVMRPRDERIPAPPATAGVRLAMRCALVILLAVMASGLTRAQEATAIDALGNGKLTVIRAGRVITMSGKTFEPGVVIVEDGKIRLVGESLDYPKSAHVLEARGQTIMPGLVQPHSRFGLSSYSRSGLKAGHTTAEEVLLSETDFEPLLEAGYTTVGLIPSGFGLPGAASVYATGGPESQRLRREAAYLRVTMSSPSRDRPLLEGSLDKAREAIEKEGKAREEWEKKQKEAAAKAEQEKKAAQEKKPPGAPEPAPEAKEAEKKPEAPAEFKPPPIDRHLVPLVELLREKSDLGLVFELSGPSDYLHLVAALERFPEISGSYHVDAGIYAYFLEVVEELGESKPLVAIEPGIGRAPYTIDRVSVAGALERAGCELVFVPPYESRGGIESFRMSVAEVVRAGVGRETALGALTINAAKLLGLEKEIGSLEKGKRADIIFLDGDPLDTHARVRRVMIDGEIVWEATP